MGDSKTEGSCAFLHQRLICTTNCAVKFNQKLQNKNNCGMALKGQNLCIKQKTKQSAQGQTMKKWTGSTHMVIATWGLEKHGGQVFKFLSPGQWCGTRFFRGGVLILDGEKIVTHTCTTKCKQKKRGKSSLKDVDVWKQWKQSFQMCASAYIADKISVRQCPALWIYHCMNAKKAKRYWYSFCGRVFCVPC